MDWESSSPDLFCFDPQPYQQLERSGDDILAEMAATLRRNGSCSLAKDPPNL